MLYFEAGKKHSENVENTGKSQGKHNFALIKGVATMQMDSKQFVCIMRIWICRCVA